MAVEPDIFQTIIRQGNNVVTAETPNDIGIGLSQEYEDPFRVSAGVLARAVFEAATETSLQSDFKKAFVWMGGAALQLTLELVFVSEDKEIDAMDNVRKLMIMASPKSEARGPFGLLKTLKPPDAAEFGKVTVSIGNLIFAQDVLITSVNPVLSRPYLSSGRPSRIPVSFAFQTRRIFSKDRVNQILKFN